MAVLHAACFHRPPPWSERAIAALLDTPGAFAVTTAHGFALGRSAADEVELLTLAVSPDARRQGQGRALLRAFEQAARDRGAKDAFLEVAADNAAALALYRAAGYVPAGRRPDYYAGSGLPKVDALVLRRAL
jgi:ribosomal-protein-alanine N-acetyltransferase